MRTESGEEVAKVHAISDAVAKAWQKKKTEPLHLIRVLGEHDKTALEELEIAEEEAFKTCKSMVASHNLNMNLVKTKYTFDKRKITFYYTAPERVDFRGLLKDLTQVFKRVRIDLRHIGVRDETALLEGNGLCGRPFCCCTFLRNFESINIKLAKDQGMPITPGKISGTCGRLMCCLKNEQSAYEELLKITPKVGAFVKTPECRGYVEEVNLITGRLKINPEKSDVPVYVNRDDVKVIKDSEIKLNRDEINALKELEDK